MGFLQAKLQEWVSIFFSTRSSWLRDRTCVSCTGREILYCWATREALRGTYSGFPPSSLSCLIWDLVPWDWGLLCLSPASVYTYKTVAHLSEGPSHLHLHFSTLGRAGSWPLGATHYSWVESWRQAELPTIYPDPLPSSWTAPTFPISSHRHTIRNSLVAILFSFSSFQ